MLEKIYEKATSLHKRHRLLPRPRLNSLLSQAIENNLITITAGAGYGKTQTVSMFLNQHHYRVAWQQLTKLDNLSARFWKGFIYALSPHNEDVRLHLELLGLPWSLAKFDQFLHILSKEIYSGSRLVFVFDDFHLIHNKSIFQFIENLVSINIENLCIILISRTNISSINNFNNHFTEESLRFSLQETDNYLKMHTISLTSDETEKIQAYTGGWPLAIYLIHLNLKKDSNSYIDPLIGTKPTIFLMIEKEIFSYYTRQWQDFLIKLSFLEEVPAGLMCELSGDCIHTMMSIIKGNMFIQYNHYTCKYHFHHIFLNFLHEKQIYLNHESINGVYMTAAKWYEKNGSTVDALTYYEKCGCYDKIWKIILHMPPDRHPKDKASRIINFLNSIPKEFKKKNPMTRVVCATFMLNNLELRAAEEDLLALLEELSEQPESAKSRAIAGEAFIVLALIKQIQKDYSYVRYYKIADLLLPEGSIRDYSNIRIIDSNNALNPNSLEKREIKRLQKAFDDAMPYASRVMNGFGYGIEYLLKAEISYFKGYLNESRSYTFEALYRAQSKNQKDIVCNAFFLLMKISFAHGNYYDAIEYMTRLQEYVKYSAEFLSMLDIAESWFYLKIGKSDKVARWLLNDTLYEQIQSPVSVGKDRLARAHYFLIEERYDELLAFSKQIETIYQRRGLWLDLVYLKILRAISLQYNGSLEQSINEFQSLYDILHENHFIMQFIEMGSYMCALINKIRHCGKHNIPEDWLDFVYSKASTYSKRQAFHKTKYYAENQPENMPPAQLTKREKEILKNLSQGLTREEIAANLVISSNTVKSALQHIYNKLDAVNSADAVRIAIQMNII